MLSGKLNDGPTSGLLDGTLNDGADSGFDERAMSRETTSDLDNRAISTRAIILKATRRKSLFTCPPVPLVARF